MIIYSTRSLLSSFLIQFHLDISKSPLIGRWDAANGQGAHNHNFKRKRRKANVFLTLKRFKKSWIENDMNHLCRLGETFCYWLWINLQFKRNQRRKKTSVNLELNQIDSIFFSQESKIFYWSKNFHLFFDHVNGVGSKWIDLLLT